ncbi:MAG TPA: tRNA preQ1(34) S-adenosylmethionine ribosyltransferase-isomerase QueA [Candidatus Tumulicola sp.]|nr:tRNA preQ1(34) S-adenosylmethionine ribosyltransferase-isomerase QueA [Candidatus Tumulicola sp.]
MTPDERSSAAYRYDLPPELIAQEPAARRDASRLMIVDGDRFEDAHFVDLPRYLNPGDVLVLNETRVIAARLRGTRGHGGKAELLLLHPARDDRYDASALGWIALAKPARRLRDGSRIAFESGGTARVVRALGGGMVEVEFQIDGAFETFLERAGRLPLPPYIHNESDEAQRRYQTVFARVPGSVAAPTASLHFTPELLKTVAERGVEIVRLTLDVGAGTFRPMTAARIDDHRMHAETYAISEEAAAAIEAARAGRRRIVAAGTTVVRALEGCFAENGRIVAGTGRTDLFITPGFDFRVVDAMITNFHLPQSSLLVLVSAFAGRERILRAYAAAIDRRYRFFSFGDAMLLSRRS